MGRSRAQVCGPWTATSSSPRDSLAMREEAKPEPGTSVAWLGEELPHAPMQREGNGSPELRSEPGPPGARRSTLRKDSQAVPGKPPGGDSPFPPHEQLVPDHGPFPPKLLQVQATQSGVESSVLQVLSWWTSSYGSHPATWGCVGPAAATVSPHLSHLSAEAEAAASS